MTHEEYNDKIKDATDSNWPEKSWQKELGENFFKRGYVYLKSNGISIERNTININEFIIPFIKQILLSLEHKIALEIATEWVEEVDGTRKECLAYRMGLAKAINIIKETK